MLLVVRGVVLIGGGTIAGASPSVASILRILNVRGSLILTRINSISLAHQERF